MALVCFNKENNMFVGRVVETHETYYLVDRSCFVSGKNPYNTFPKADYFASEVDEENAKNLEDEQESRFQAALQSFLSRRK